MLATCKHKRFFWPTPQRLCCCHFSLQHAAASKISSTSREHGSRAGCPVCPLFRPLTVALCAPSNAPAAEQSAVSSPGSRRCLKEASCKHPLQPHDLAMRCLCSLQRSATQPVCWTCAHCVFNDLLHHMLQSPAGGSSPITSALPRQPATAHGVRHEGGDLGWRRVICGTPNTPQHPQPPAPALSLLHSQWAW